MSPAVDPERLLGAVIAAHPELTLRHGHIAQMLGDKSVSAVEHSLRSAKRQSREMIESNDTVYKEIKGFLDEQAERYRNQTLRQAGVRVPEPTSTSAQAPTHSLATGRPVKGRQPAQSSGTGLAWGLKQSSAEKTEQRSAAMENQPSALSAASASTSFVMGQSLGDVDRAVRARRPAHTPVAAAAPNVAASSLQVPTTHVLGSLDAVGYHYGVGTARRDTSAAGTSFQIPDVPNLTSLDAVEYSHGVDADQQDASAAASTFQVPELPDLTSFDAITSHQGLTSGNPPVFQHQYQPILTPRLMTWLLLISVATQMRYERSALRWLLWSSRPSTSTRFFSLPPKTLCMTNTAFGSKSPPSEEVRTLGDGEGSVVAKACKL
ncbi:hypothetical protein N7457_002685 [Penicillium paradoxum]|uniref:uncharacterized protein n=1 Tax=Penicillium paradoxum TaxID=176176 RepID=UPI0025477192|nr:uncharacterized protein N7457_002685 [Penicillium paradoxum]KAJ5787695.1 hypothetical protein N7457_002685 [Penicillium paradoxum]